MRILLLTFLALAVAPALAQWPEGEAPNRFDLRLGGQFFTGFDTRLRVDGQTGDGTDFQMEFDLDLDGKPQVARLDGAYNFNRRHNLTFSIYSVDRSQSTILQREIEFDGEIYPIGTTVEASQKTDFFKLNYGFNFLLRPKGVFSMTAGLHVMRFASSIAALDDAIRAEASLDAPLPTIGLQGHYQFLSRWRLTGNYEIFDLTVGDVRGSFSDFVAAVEYDAFERTSFGFGLNDMRLRVDASSRTFPGRISFGFDSLLLYVRGRIGTRQARNQ